jgi:hypothetical protein
VFVDSCLDLVGPMTVNEDTREELLSAAVEEGDLSFATEAERLQSSDRVSRLLQLIVATREYQFG